MLRILTVIAIAALVACSRPSSEQLLHGVPPFAHLKIQLHMSEAQLREARPQAQFAPYSGMSETIDSAQVLYRFNSGEQAIDDGARMSEVSASRSIAGDSAQMQQRLSSEIAKLSTLIGAPAKCGAIRNSLWSASVAMWRKDKTALTVGIWTEDGASRLVFSLMDESKIRALTSERPCGDG